MSPDAALRHPAHTAQLPVPIYSGRRSSHSRGGGSGAGGGRGGGGGRGVVRFLHREGGGCYAGRDGGREGGREKGKGKEGESGLL